MIRILAALPLLAAGGGALAQAAETAVARFVDEDGEANGTAELWALPSGGVMIRIEVTGLPENSWVAFHVHETGSCDHETDHESAGGHFNPEESDHGFLSPGGPHAGDMPNQYVPADGTLRSEVVNSSVTLTDGVAGVRGRALMIHAKADDHESQPAGDAGDRLACAVIE